MHQFLLSALPYIEIGLSVLLVAVVLLQQSDASVGSAFGGGDSFSSVHRTRRGFEKFLFVSTIVIAILFAASAFLALVI